MRRKRLLVLFAILFIGLMTGSLACDSRNDNNGKSVFYCDPDNWYIYTVDSDANAGYHTSIAVDSNGNPHISYFDYKLKYSKNDGDIEDYIYYLKHASKKASGWHISTVKEFEVTTEDSSPFRGHSSIALDSKNNAHISSCISYEAGIWYAKSERNGWQLSEVDSKTYYCSTSIAIDSHDSPHIAYSIAYSIKYAQKSSKGWDVQQVGRGETVSISLDSTDNVYISCVEKKFNQDIEALKYITNASGSWQSIDVFSTDRSLYYSGIAVDSYDKLHIICMYGELLKAHILYAENTAGIWQSFAIDSGYAYRGYPSISIDPMNFIHISYYDGMPGDLKYATNASGTWGFFTIDSEGDTGRYTSIATDSIGCVHISYFNESTNDLMYVTNRSSY